MSFPNITYQAIVNLCTNSMKSCANVDGNYTSLASQFKSGYSNQIALPVWWDSSYTDKGYGYTDQGYTSGQGTDYRYNGPDYRGDYNNLHTTTNRVTITSGSVITQISSSTIDSQMTNYLTLLGVNSVLNTNIKEDKFLWFINNLFAYYKARVRWASSVWKQDTIPVVYLNFASVTTPFYPTSHMKAGSYVIKAQAINDLFNVFTPTKSGMSVYTITYNYSYYHDKG